MAKKSSARGELENFLNGLGLETKPAIHVNGKDHPTALVTVDFGYPTPPVRLSQEQSQELGAKLRKFARELLSDVAIQRLNAEQSVLRVSSDNYLGVVYWVALQHNREEA